VSTEADNNDLELSSDSYEDDFNDYMQSAAMQEADNDNERVEDSDDETL
jgi:hypothetical protein